MASIGALEASALTAVQAIRAVAAFGLPGSRPGPVEIQPGQAAQLVNAVLRERLTGPAVAAVDAGWLEIPEESRGTLFRHHLGAMQWVLTLERHLIVLGEAFD